MLHAADVMSRPVVTVRNATSLQEAGNLLADYGFAGIPVVDDDGVLLGMLTSGDVLRADRERQRAAGSAMTAPAIAAEMFTGIDDVGQLLLAPGIRSVPVVDDEHRVIGIVSRGDLLRISNTSDDAVAVGVQKLLDDYTGKRRWIAVVRGGDVTIAGVFDDDSERRIAAALAQMVPGTRTVRLGAQLD